ncbi:MAG: hypothetical protein EXR71_11805 [Myxococcales bacterium]|nr:hypothetical protein [Myxococcales bacterium]
MRYLLLLLCVAGCFTSEPPDDTSEDDDTADPEGDPATIPLAGACTLDRRWGGFKVEANVDYSAVDGAITNGVVPVRVLSEALVEGDCKLLKRGNPFCDPTCGPTETCDFDGECIPNPENQDLGTVTITGLTDPVVMEPLIPTNQYSFTDVDNPAFDAGKLVRLQTAGGAYAPLTMHGVGVIPLVPGSTTWLVTAGSPVPLTWDVPPSAVRSDVFVSVNVDQHGLTPLTLWCSFADDGAAEIPASVMDALLNGGVTGYPSGKIQRRTVDHVMLGDGCADFMVDYSLTAKVSVSGHTPCSTPADCPDGQECDLALQTCE